MSESTIGMAIEVDGARMHDIQIRREAACHCAQMLTGARLFNPSEEFTGAAAYKMLFDEVYASLQTKENDND
jgi:uncharacterized protein YjaG (DUF416 family)